MNKIIYCYFVSVKASTQNQEFIDNQIAKLEKKMKNLLDIYADGEISRDEYKDMRNSYEKDLAGLKEQKESFAAQRDIFGNCMDDMDKVAKILSSMIDLSSPDMSKNILNEVITSIVPEGNNGRYRWTFRLTKETESSCGINVSGTKRCAKVYLDGQKEEASDTDASDIHIKTALSDTEGENVHKISLLPVAKAHPEKLSLLTNLHRRQSLK